MMSEFEKQIHAMFDHIWDCEIEHPIFQDTVGDLMNAVIQCYEHLPSSQPQWIFCNKKYPEMDERVLVNLDGYCDCHVWDCMSNRGDDYFWEDDQGLSHNKYEVIAWMPLPEPYKGEE